MDDPVGGPTRLASAERTITRTFQSLRTRNFRLFYIGQSISNTGNWLTNVALILFVLQLTGSGLAVGILTACQFGPLLFLSAWAGAVADRVEKRRMLIATQALEMAQSTGLAIVAFLPRPSLLVLYALAVGGGVVLALDNPLRRSFVPEMVPEDDLPNAVVLYSTIISLSQIFGPTLAGLLATTLGFGWCFTIDAASYLAVIACLAMMRASDLRPNPPAPRTRREVREGLRYVASVPDLWISFAMFGAIGIFSFNLRVSLPLFVTLSLDGSEVAFTILYSILSLGAVIGALVVAQRRFVRLPHVIGGSIAFGLGMLLLAAMPSVAAAVPVVFLVGAASIVYRTATTSLAQVDIRRDMHGRVLALQTALMGGTALVGGPIVGRIADIGGGRAPIVVGGIVCLITAGLGSLARRRAAADT
ncbi:MAG: MFS transporter [Vicinamibacterales bacterium]